MNESHDDLDRWLRPTVEPLPAPEGTFHAVRKKARRRRWAHASTSVAAAVLVCVGGISGGWLLAWGSGPGDVTPPVVASHSTAAHPSPAMSAGQSLTQTPRTETPEESSSPGTGGSPAPEHTEAAEPTAGTPPPAVVTETPGDDTTDEPAPPPCETAQLGAAIEPSGAAAGNRYATLVFTNQSDTACTLDGHPGILLLDENKDPLPTEVHRQPPEPQQVLLEPGGRASATLHWGSAAMGGKPKHPPSKYARVTPPDVDQGITVPFEARPYRNVIDVSSMVAGAGGV